MIKQRILQTIVALLAIAGDATAQTLSVASIEATAGGQAELEVSASGMAGVTALQFNLALPQGVTLNESAITKSNAAGIHTLSVQTMANGDRLIVLCHTDLELLRNGTLLRLPITVGQQTGSFSGSLYTVRTANTAAESHECSAVGFNITVKAAAQPVTITADNKTMTYGDEVPTLTYKSSGATLNGTPKLSTTATKTSTVGTYPIKVEKGTVTNEQVTYVDGTLTIGKAPLTVGVQNVTITEGDAIPTFTLTYNGFRNNDWETDAFTTKPTATTTATSTSKPGTYPITVSGGAAQNYALTYTQGTLTITAKAVQPVTITANDKTMTYGDDVPALTYKSSGATLNGTPKLSTTATKTSPVGTYPIKVEKGTVTNEQVTYVDGTLTIGKAPLTVGVQNVTITEGDAIPTFTLTYSGFRNNDSETNTFTTKPTASTTATSASKPGTYPITVSGGAAQNYALTYTQGTLTIEEKPEVLPDVSGMTKVHDLDFTQGDYYITLNENDQRGTAWETGNAKRQKIYNVATPAEMSNVLALQAAYSGESGSKGWWVRGSKGGLWCYSATRSAAVLNLSKGDIVVFESSADVANAITLTNGSGEPDGPFTFVKTRDGKAYYCTMTANGQLGFCGVKNNGYITSIKVYSNNASGIRDIKAAQSLDGEIYDLFGRKLTTPKKGFNIIGGKKVFVP